MLVCQSSLMAHFPLPFYAYFRRLLCVRRRRHRLEQNKGTPASRGDGAFPSYRDSSVSSLWSCTPGLFSPSYGPT